MKHQLDDRKRESARSLENSKSIGTCRDGEWSESLVLLRESGYERFKLVKLVKLVRYRVASDTTLNLSIGFGHQHHSPRRAFITVLIPARRGFHPRFGANLDLE